MAPRDVSRRQRVVKAIFDTRAVFGYYDDIIRRYHFPNRYLDEALRPPGDWIIYREPGVLEPIF